MKITYSLSIMKKIIHLLVILLSLAAASCSKEEPVEKPSIVGYWVGTYDSSMPFAMVFKKDNTVLVYANNKDTTLADKAIGIYGVNDTTARTIYKYIGAKDSYSTIGHMDIKLTKMSGTWGLGDNETNGGVFVLEKQ